MHCECMSTVQNVKHISKLYTHAGCFHADEVFSLALFRLIGCEAECLRVNKLPDILSNTELAFDIGFGKYDHHQQTKKERGNGVPYASFGLLLRDYYPALGLNESQYEHLDRTFAQGLDSRDNGLSSDNQIAQAIHLMNPNWDEDQSPEANQAAFDTAVAMAITILDRQVQRILSYDRAKMKAEQALDTLDNGVVYLEQYAPIGEYLKFSHEAKWVCYPSRGGWTLMNLPSFNGVKARLPKIFCGKPTELLPRGMTFCHRGGFLASFETLDDVKRFAAGYLAK